MVVGCKTVRGVCLWKMVTYEEEAKDFCKAKFLIKWFVNNCF